jgi:hypothetical protein
VDGALLARERLLAQIEQARRDELLEEEAHRDAAMCAWIDFETVYGEDKLGAA